MNIPIEKFESYLKSKGLMERTIQEYIYYYNKFTFEIFNQDTVSRFLAEKSNRNLPARSFLTNLKGFLKANYKALGIPEEVRKEIIEVEFPKISGRTKQRVIRTIPHNQIPLLEEALETEELKLQMLLGYYCGLRLGEMYKLRLISFNWELWKINIEDSGEGIVFGKGNKERTSYIPSFLMKRLAKFIRSNEYESLNSRLFSKKEKIDIKNESRTFQNKLRGAGIKCGITKLDENGKIIEGTGVHYHKLRHSFASHLLNDMKLNLIEVKDALGHSSIQSTEIYTHINKEDLKNKLKNIEK